MHVRLFPKMPEGRYVCFYPMDRKRGELKNWYTLPIEERQRQMDCTERSAAVTPEKCSRSSAALSASTIGSGASISLPTIPSSSRNSFTRCVSTKSAASFPTLEPSTSACAARPPNCLPCSPASRPKLSLAPVHSLPDAHLAHNRTTRRTEVDLYTRSSPRIQWGHIHRSLLPSGQKYSNENTICSLSMHMLPVALEKINERAAPSSRPEMRDRNYAPLSSVIRDSAKQSHPSNPYFISKGVCSIIPCHIPELLLRCAERT